MGGAILTLVSRVKKLERTVKQLRTARLVGDAPATEGDVDTQDAVDLEGLSRMASEAMGHNPATVPSEDIEAREEEEVPLRRKRSIHRRARTEFNTSAFAQFHAPHSSDVLPHADISESAGPSVGADKGKAPMPDLEIPAEFLAEDAQARQERVWLIIANGFSYQNLDGIHFPYSCWDEKWLVQEQTAPGAKGLTSPEQTATGKGISNPLMAVMVCPKPYGIQLTNVSIWKLLLRDVAASFDSAVHRDHAGSFDAVVPSLVSAACVAAAASLVPAALQSSCLKKIYLETWN
ncbi:hypothetical protein Tco_0312422 [Tanacetum coccineum]